MNQPLGEASVQYGDWKGTVAADNSDKHRALEELAGIDSEQWDVCAIEIYGAYEHTWASVLAVDRSSIESFESWAELAHANGGVIPVRRFQVKVEDDNAALQLLTTFKRWSIHATMRHAIHDQGFDVAEIAES